MINGMKEKKCEKHISWSQKIRKLVLFHLALGINFESYPS